MLRKILKYTLRVFLILLAVALLLIAAVYLPPVQDFARRKALASLSESTGLDLSVEKLRLSFPVKLTVDNALAVAPQGDTLLNSRHLYVHVKLLPLFVGRAEVEDVTLEDVSVDYSDPLSGMELKATLGHFSLKATANLLNNSVEVPFVNLDTLFARVVMGPSQSPPDTLEQVQAAPLDWRISAGELSLAGIDAELTMMPDGTFASAVIPAGGISGLLFDMGRQDVAVDKILISDASYTFLADTAAVVKAEAMPADTLLSDVLPWTVNVGSFGIVNNSAKYGLPYGVPSPGFDINHLEVTDINIVIDSVYNRGADASAVISSFSLRERSGLSVNSAQGAFVMDSTRLMLSGFDLRTDNSVITANAGLGAGLSGIGPATPLNANVYVNIGSKDIFLIHPLEEPLAGMLNEKSFVAEADVSGIMDHIVIKELSLAMPGHFILSAGGEVGSAMEPEKLSADISLDGDFADMAFIRELLADSLTRQRIAIPAMALRGDIKVDKDVYTPDITLSSGEGVIRVDGFFDSGGERYDIRLASDSFPLYSFLPADSLGRLTLGLESKGVKFDPFDPAMVNETSLELTDFSYKGYNYADIRLGVDYADNTLDGNIASDSRALDLGIWLSGKFMREKQDAEIKGDIRALGLGEMRFTQEYIGASLVMDIKASASASGNYALAASFDSIRFSDGVHDYKIRLTEIDLSAGPEKITAALTTGDMGLEASTRCSPDTLSARASYLASVLAGQISALDFDMGAVNRALPCYTLLFFAGQDNFLHSYLNNSGLGFGTLALASSASDDAPFDFTFTADRVDTGGIVFDTLALRLDGVSDVLNYEVLVTNILAGEGAKSRITLGGDVDGRKASLHAVQHDSHSGTGIDIGLRAGFADNTVTASVDTYRLVLGSEEWNANAGNFISYGLNNRHIEADFELSHGDKGFLLRSVDEQKGNLRFGIRKLDIANAMDPIPGTPDIEGVLDADLLLNTKLEFLGANGDLGVSGLAYDGKNIGDIGLALGYDHGAASGGHNFSGGMTVNGLDVANMKVLYDAGGGGNIDAALSVPGFPLEIANPFMPEDMARLSGKIVAEITAVGELPSPEVNGRVKFDTTKISIPMIGMDYRLSDSDIIIAGNDVRFNDFAVIAPDNSRLALNGHIDLGSFDNITTDLRADASGFRVVNVKRHRGSIVYGTASIDLATTIKGPLDELVLRGDVSLLGGTDVTYIMQDNSLDIREGSQDIVKFVSFADTLDTEKPEIREARLGGMDILMNIDIQQDAKVSVFLSQDGQNRINIQGGGNLTYAANQLGDTRLSGRYELSGGTVSYNPPVISAKTFKITEGSYILWTGEMMNPEMNITAVEKVSTNVQVDESNTRRVAFEISINIRNSLENIEITFDLAAPQDLTIHNELQSMTAEQRSNQAMGLMIYNTYDGPGSVAKVTGNPLNQFVENELNRWAQDNLRGVDLSFGIDSYDQMTEGGHSTRTDYSYQLSKSFFNNRMRTVVGGSVSTDSEDPNNVKDNLIDDISLEYMLTKRDNMFLKVFRHTGYESILEGEVVQTGFSFVVRKKMNRLRELFMITRAKQIEEEKKSRKEELADEKPAEAMTEEKDGIKDEI